MLKGILKIVDHSVTRSITRLTLVTMVIGMISCEEKVKDYVTLSGKISNNQEEDFELFNFDTEGPPEKIKINSDGTFSSTFKMVKPDVLFINYADKQHRIFARNGYDLNLTWNGVNKDTLQLTFNDLQISGHGSDIVNHHNEAMFDDSDKLNGDSYKLDRSSFEKLLDERIAKRLNKAPTSDTLYTSYLKKTLKWAREYDLENYETKQKRLAQIGTPSPLFIDYESIDGQKVSLDDFRGKYVFLDFWATWCVPCIAEMPHLKELEAEYHGKNIEFIGISIDVKERKEAWKKMVEEKELTGVQLINYNESESEFIKTYNIDAIPRYILIDPEGKIVSADAPVPSQKEAVKELFEPLNL